MRHSTQYAAQEYSRGEFSVSTEQDRLDLDTIYDFLTNSYWAQGISRALVQRSIENSLCFGVYQGLKQVGFARVVSDFATFAYIADVFILESHRGHGLGKWLMACIMQHPELQNLRRWSLVTRDAHELYRQFGFQNLRAPECWMERHDPDVYTRNN
jgi:GNAT superfamily N-acetyltransferase